MRFLLSLFITCSTLLSFAQSAGYLRKKHTVSISLNVKSPVLYNMSNASYRDGYANNEYKDGEFVEQRNLLEVGYNFAYAYAFTRKLGVAVNLSNESYKLSPFLPTVKDVVNQYGNYTQRFLIQASYLKANHNFMQTGIVLSSKQGVLPFGLSQELGGGFGQLSFADNNAAYMASESDTYFDPATNQQIYTQSINVYEGDAYYDQNFVARTYNVYYKLKMNYPISDFMFLHMALNYTYFWSRTYDSEINNDPYRYAGGYELLNGLRTKFQLPIARVEFGAVFPF